MTLPVCPQVSGGRIRSDEDWFLGWGWRAQAGGETAPDQQRLGRLPSKRQSGGRVKGVSHPSPLQPDSGGEEGTFFILAAPPPGPLSQTSL